MAGPAAAATGVPGREADPIVLTGSDTPALLGAPPSAAVAYTSHTARSPLRAQVDERAVVDYGLVRQIGSGFQHEAYADPGTFAGADPDPTVDDGDEIAFMARDAGAPADTVASPAGVDSATRTAVSVADPLDPDAEYAVYLFATTSGLDPSAGRSYVDYDFSLNSGDYRTTYDFNGVPDVEADAPPANPEDSTVTTSAYTQHLLSRWITDGMTLRTGATPSADILDGDKAQVGRGCGRSELTFSRGGGGFIANKSGPIRAIRSQIGANSGTYTQRDDIFYERRQDSFTYLRVHAGIAQISQFRDYSAAASGMSYRNSAYPAGVTIDGVPDPGIPVPIGASDLQPATEWEQVAGSAGSLTTVTRADTNLPGYTSGSFYRDQGGSPTFGQCGGYADYQSYGTSGSEFKSSNMANSDPTLGPAYNLTATRSTFFDEPNADAADAVGRSEQVDAPLETAVEAEQEPEAPALRLTAKGPRKAVKPGKSARFEVRVANDGGPAANVEICPKGPKRLVDVGDCKGSRTIVHRKILRSFRVRVSGKAKRPIKIRFKATADGAKATTTSARIQIKR